MQGAENEDGMACFHGRVRNSIAMQIACSDTPLFLYVSLVQSRAAAGFVPNRSSEFGGIARLCPRMLPAWPKAWRAMSRRSEKQDAACMEPALWRGMFSLEAFGCDSCIGEAGFGRKVYFCRSGLAGVFAVKFGRRWF